MSSRYIARDTLNIPRPSFYGFQNDGTVFGTYLDLLVYATPTHTSYPGRRLSHLSDPTAGFHRRKLLKVIPVNFRIILHVSDLYKPLAGSFQTSQRYGKLYSETSQRLRQFDGNPDCVGLVEVGLAGADRVRDRGVPGTATQ